MVKESSIRAALVLIREVYIDKELAEKTAAAIEEYLDSPVGKRRLELEDPGTLLWDINSIIAANTHDLHFGFVNAYTQGNNGVQDGILRAMPHYLHIARMDVFANENVRARFSRVFDQLQDPVVLDLRNCSGGDAESVYFMLCHFFPDGTHLFDLHTRHGPVRSFKAASTAPVYETYNRVRKYNGRLKVFVNGSTYSGGEILAKTLQSHGRAKVYGTQTPGAFNVTNYTRFDDIVLHLPFGKFVDGADQTDSDKVGVTPDFGPVTREYISTVFSEVSEYQFNSY